MNLTEMLVYLPDIFLFVFPGIICLIVGVKLNRKLKHTRVGQKRQTSGKIDRAIDKSYENQKAARSRAKNERYEADAHKTRPCQACGRYISPSGRCPYCGSQQWVDVGAEASDLAGGIAHEAADLGAEMGYMMAKGTSAFGKDLVRMYGVGGIISFVTACAVYVALMVVIIALYVHFGIDVHF